VDAVGPLAEVDGGVPADGEYDRRQPVPPVPGGVRGGPLLRFVGGEGGGREARLERLRGGGQFRDPAGRVEGGDGPNLQLGLQLHEVPPHQVVARHVLVVEQCRRVGPVVLHPDEHVPPVQVAVGAAAEGARQHPGGGAGGVFGLQELGVVDRVEVPVELLRERRTDLLAGVDRVVRRPPVGEGGGQPPARPAAVGVERYPAAVRVLRPVRRVQHPAELREELVERGEHRPRFRRPEPDRPEHGRLERDHLVRPDVRPGVLVDERGEPPGRGRPVAGFQGHEHGVAEEPGRLALGPRGQLLPQLVVRVQLHDAGARPARVADVHPEDELVGLGAEPGVQVQHDHRGRAREGGGESVVAVGDGRGPAGGGARGADQVLLEPALTPVRPDDGRHGRTSEIGDHAGESEDGFHLRRHRLPVGRRLAADLRLRQPPVRRVGIDRRRRPGVRSSVRYSSTR